MNQVIDPENVPKNVAVNLRRALDDRGWSVSVFIAKTGIPQNTAYRYLRGENEPSITHLAAIHDAMGVSIDWLISDHSAISEIQP